MNPIFDKHRENFTPVAKQAAATASNKPSREIKSVPHIKLTKSQLEFILKMPIPMVKRFERSFDEYELYQKLMDEKNINAALKNHLTRLIEVLNNVNKIAWDTHDTLTNGSYDGRIRQIKYKIQEIIGNLTQPVNRSRICEKHENLNTKEAFHLYKREWIDALYYYRYERKLNEKLTNYKKIYKWK